MGGRLRGIARRLTGVALAALLVSCATPADDRALHGAEVAVERARSAPRVRALAPRELDDAEVALALAGDMLETGAGGEWVDHFAYLAARRAALAEARATERIARARVAALDRELDRAWADAPASARRHLEEDQIALTGRSAVIVSLAELPFEGVEPGSDAVDQVDGMVEALSHDAHRRVLLVAAFDAPDPDQRTVLERRVEVVRTLFTRRGVDPSRILVRAGANIRPAASMHPSASAQGGASIQQ